MEIDKNLEAKIRKLLKLQEGAQEIGNVHEAANAAAKLQDILLKHNLDISNINLKDHQDPEVGQGGIDIGGRTKKNEGEWILSLFHHVGLANMCHPILIKRKGRECKIVLVGTEMNVDMTQYICDQLIPRLRDLCKKYWKKYEGTEKVNAFTRAFLKHAAIEVGKRLKENIVDAAKTNEGIAGLVRVTNALVKDYVEKNFNTVPTKQRQYSASSGAALGRQAGRNVEINKGVGQEAPSSRLLN